MRVSNGLAGKPGFSVHYAPDNGADGSANGSQQDTPKPASGADAGDNASKGAMTQEQVNAIVKERLDRQKARLEAEHQRKIESLGVTADEAEEYKTWKANKAEEDRKRKEQEGRYQEILKEQTTKFQTEIQARDNQIAEVTSRFHGTMIENAIADLLSDAKLKGHSPAQVASLVRSHFKVDPNSLKIIVVDENGNEAISKTGAPHTPESFMAEWLLANPHFRKPLGGGSGYAPNGKPGQQIRRSQIADRKFYLANKDAIEEAAKAGLIIDDVNGGGR